MCGRVIVRGKHGDSEFFTVTLERHKSKGSISIQLTSWTFGLSEGDQLFSLRPRQSETVGLWEPATLPPHPTPQLRPPGEETSPGLGKHQCKEQGWQNGAWKHLLEALVCISDEETGLERNEAVGV